MEVRFSMSNELKTLVDAAKRHAMSKEELRELRIAFVHANLPKGQAATRQDVREVLAKVEDFV
jgi:hypothetical protein